MEDKSFFVVPTFIYGFNNKQYLRFIEQLKEFSIPCSIKEDFAYLYNPIESNMENIPEKIRNEFKINRLEKDKQSTPQGFYQKHSKNNYFLNLNIFLNKMH